MKKTICCIALVICILTSLACLSACNQYTVKLDDLDVGQIKVMSLNLRHIYSEDTGNRSWKHRKTLVATNIQETQPTIIGMQEVTPKQYEDCKNYLKNYNSEITYRDTTENSEGCPIFYYKDLYTLVSKGTFWLSETPDVVSKDWGSAYCRICTYVVLRDKHTGKQFAVFNTQLDNESKTARVNGIDVIMEKIQTLHDCPTILMGDFNATENSQVYITATKTLSDVKYLTENDYVNCATYHNWGQKLNNKPIDYILITKTGFTVNSYNVVNTTYKGDYVSDHFPILSTLKFA